MTLRIAISNIAWDVSEDAAVADLLAKHGVDAIDIAPSKYFPVFAEASDDAILAVRQWWAERGIELTGMQSLLYGTTGLNVFGSDESRSAMLAHLEHVCRIGGISGAKRLVFGSPKNRDRSHLADEATRAIAVTFFRQLGDIALRHGVTVCLEPNPAEYGANFMTTSAETAQIVRAIDHPAIRMQLDTGAIAMNHEDIVATLNDCSALIGHIHASEPQLMTLGDSGIDHAPIARALRDAPVPRLVSIEMLASSKESHLDAMDRALTTAIKAYRQGIPA